LHWPWQYEVAPLHTTPQPPQFCGSLFSLTHCPLQQIKPDPHAGLQPPPEPPELELPDEPPELPPPEPPELPPLPPVASVEASEPVVVVDPPHCAAPMATAPTRPSPRGQFEEMPMTPSFPTKNGMPARTTGHVKQSRRAPLGNWWMSRSDGMTFAWHLAVNTSGFGDLTN
jgi:hypothetical protein